MLRWLWLTLLVVVLDLASKALISHHFSLYETMVVIPGWFNLTLAHNAGAAFSFLANESGWQRWFFAIIAISVSLVIFFWIKRLQSHERWLAIALALVLGGALGNLWDRLTLGYVVDFLDVYYLNRETLTAMHWPAFNIADSAISIGAVMLIIDAFWGNEKHDDNEYKH
ncbi:MAG: signal peptidase II [gamma proteobacterium symbiont of Taylorina sp.]|nr:signal peptidase II [gamma proteobacterium symbiont of Taylorina sp.]